jgi:hypothetical protein
MLSMRIPIIGQRGDRYTEQAVVLWGRWTELVDQHMDLGLLEDDPAALLVAQ